MSPVFATRRRAEEFEAVVDGTVAPRGASAGPVRRPARARRRATRRTSAAAAAGVRRRAAGAAGRRGRDAAGRAAGRGRPAPAAHARPGPGPQPARTPPRGRHGRVRPGRRHGHHVGRRPVGAARRRCSTRSSAASSRPTPASASATRARARTLLASASTRLDEVARLDAGEHEAEIADTLDDFTAQAIEASDLLLALVRREARRPDRHRAARASPPPPWSRWPTSTASCRRAPRTSGCTP